MRANRIALSLALLLCILLAAYPAPGSDNDERPAYMIYIDPETGRYTTEKPSREESLPPAITVAGKKPAAGGVIMSAYVPELAAGALLLLLALLLWGTRLKRAKVSNGSPRSR